MVWGFFSIQLKVSISKRAAPLKFLITHYPLPITNHHAFLGTKTTTVAIKAENIK